MRPGDPDAAGAGVGTRPYPARVPERRGLLLGTAAYVIWGAFPLYFPLLEPAGAVEILAHRVLWSAATMLLLVVVLRRSGAVRALLADRRRALLLTLAAVVISVNWVTYIWGVNNDRVVEASLGYFINPLVTVLLGVLVLGERLRRLQWVAIGIACAAVAVLTWDYGEPPYVALVLALSFGSYGLIKKTADAGAVESLTVETLVLAPVAGAYLVVIGVGGTAQFGQHGWGHALLFMSAGVVTAVPLLCFNGAATRIPMVTLGLLQYLTPVLQFACGVLVFGEQMPPARWAGFALVWLALAVFTVETLQNRRRQLRLAAAASTAA